MASKNTRTTNGGELASAREFSTPRLGDDFHAWAIAQASALRERNHAVLDWSNLAEELEGMTRKDRRELRSHLQKLIIHLLKWAYDPKRRGASWRATINTSRDNIHDFLGESPSLRNVLQELLAESKAYGRAVREATIETENKISFPAQSPWTLDQLLDSDFLPD
jgi:hypothetical protein